LAVVAGLPVAFLVASVALAAEKIVIENEAVTLPEYDFGALPRRDDGVVAVFHGLLGAAIVLPYSERWTLEILDDGRLTGESDSYAFTLSAFGGRDDGERRYLEGIAKNVGAVSVLNSEELLKDGDDVVLRYQSRPEELPAESDRQHVWWWHYWSVERIRGVWVDLHVTVLAASSELPELDPGLAALLGKGLRAIPSH